MSGVQNFVRGGQPGSVPSELVQSRSDRAHAKNLKINPKASHPQQQYSHGQSDFPLDSKGENPFDYTATSGFESSREDTEIENADDAYYAEDHTDDNYYECGVNSEGQYIVKQESHSMKAAMPISFKQPRRTSPVYQQSQSPGNVANVDQTSTSRKQQPGISGRFQGSNHQSRQSSHGPEEKVQVNGGKKRTHPHDEYANNGPQYPEDEDLDQVDDNEEEVKIKGVMLGRAARDDIPEKDMDESDIHTDSPEFHGEEDLHVANGQMQQDSQVDDTPDYDDATLKQMSYAQLSKEDFDTIPNPSTPNIPDELRDPQTSLQEKLGYCVQFLSGGIDKEKDARGDMVVLFFSGISKKEWEEAGDWFLDHFGETMKKMRDARQTKRAAIAEYESKIEKREEAVRKKQEELEQDLMQMKEKGKSVLQGKSSSCLGSMAKSPTA